jgi:hypothetical protein
MSDEPTINTNFSITHFIKKKKKNTTLNWHLKTPPYFCCYVYLTPLHYVFTSIIYVAPALAAAAPCMACMVVPTSTSLGLGWVITLIVHETRHFSLFYTTSRPSHRQGTFLAMITSDKIRC